MYIVAIGWLYVVVMIAVVSDSLLKAVVRLLLLGVLPVAILLWTRRLRRPRPRKAAPESGEAGNDRAAGNH